MFEQRNQPLIARRRYLKRLTRHLCVALSIVAGALSLGVCGYRCAEGLSWLDALLNASMILSGMGPVTELHTTAGKLFASFYALFSGVAFITTAGVIFAPVFHRFLHKFHLDLASEAAHKKGTQQIP